MSNYALQSHRPRGALVNPHLCLWRSKNIPSFVKFYSTYSLRSKEDMHTDTGADVYIGTSAWDARAEMALRVCEREVCFAGWL